MITLIHFDIPIKLRIINSTDSGQGSAYGLDGYGAGLAHVFVGVVAEEAAA